METNRTDERKEAMPAGSLEKATRVERPMPVLRGIVSAGWPSGVAPTTFSAGRCAVSRLTNRL